MGRFLVVAGLVAVLVAACVATGDIEFFVGASHPPEAVREVEGIVEAAHRHGAEETALAVGELLHVAEVRGGRAGLRLLREGLPPLAARLVGELPATLGEIRAVEVATPLGAACRQAALRLLERDGWVLRELAGGKPTAKAIERFVAGYEANARGYEADVEKCLALADADERPAVAHLMGAL